MSRGGGVGEIGEGTERRRSLLARAERHGHS